MPTTWLIVNTIFVHLRPWYTVLVWPLGAGDWVVKISCTGAVCLCEWPSLKPRHQGFPWWASLVGNTSHVLSHIFAGRIKHIFMQLHWEGTPGSLSPLSPGPYSMSPFHLLILICILNCNSEYNSSSGSYEPFYWIIKPEGSFGTPNTVPSCTYSATCFTPSTL